MIIKLEKGGNIREIIGVDTTDSDVKLIINGNKIDLTTDIDQTKGFPLLKFSKNSIDYYIREILPEISNHTIIQFNTTGVKDLNFDTRVSYDYIKYKGTKYTEDEVKNLSIAAYEDVLVYGFTFKNGYNEVFKSNSTLYKFILGDDYRSEGSGDSCASMFFSCTKLTTLDLSNFNTSNVTNMYGMFGSCSSLTTLDLSSFNASKVTNMRYMFQNCQNLTTLDISNFNTSNVTNMSSMFYNCTSLTKVYCHGKSWTQANLQYMCGNGDSGLNKSPNKTTYINKTVALPGTYDYITFERI